MLIRDLQSNNHGQGLLETIIAFTVIAVGISGVISLSGSNLIASNVSSKEVVAINLAREGVELVTNLRDSNYLDQLIIWNQGLESGATDDDGILEYNELTYEWSVNFLASNTTTADAEARIYWDPGIRMYRQSSSPQGDWEATPYSRAIEINRICSEDVTDFRDGSLCSGTVIGYRIVAEVAWDDHGNIQSNRVEKRIYNWR